jgi:Tol biopolymer transport system component/DNA-binding winged helix-turn-helix (wHTH) protein
MQDSYEFASFRFDFAKQCLTHGETVISLTPKEFTLLKFLLENRHRTVGKDEILENVWSETYVEEGTLTRNISWLRKKLADHSDAKIIETVPKRGYRFLPEILTAGASETLIVEEKTIRHIQIEETIEFEPNEISDGADVTTAASLTAISGANYKALPAAPSKNRRATLWIMPILLILAAFIFVSQRAYFSQEPTGVILTTKIAPFSGLPGRENSPNFSPDGKQMVFSWDGGIENANSDIYVKLIGAGEPVRLTDTANEELNPVFAPDGKSIAFVRIYSTHNEIIMIPALGGAERKVYEKASYASLSFSPDGKLLAAAELDLSGGQAGIFTINLQTGEKIKLTAPDNPAVDHTPRFSPDGKYLAFIRYFSSFRREIFVVPASGGEAWQITSDDVRIYGLAWNTDSRSLFFTSFRGNQQLNLWHLAIDRGGDPQLIATGSKKLQDLAVSPDGRMVAFVEELNDENIWEITPDQKPRPVIRSTRADHSQQFSPDNTQIVFVSDRTGNYEIWISDADGKNQRQLTAAAGSAGSPRFSPDGKLIVYDAQTAGSSDIYIVSANGGSTPRQLTEGGSNSLPAWSADGKTVFFISNRSGSDQMWKMSADGGGETTQITKNGAFEMFAAPDGKTIIYSKGGGKAGLWSVGIDGADEKPLAELAAAGAFRSWSAASNGIYYTTFATQPPFHLEFFDFATRQTKVILNTEKPPLAYYSNLSVSSDGRKIFQARQDQSASSILLAELK